MESSLQILKDLDKPEYGLDHIHQIKDKEKEEFESSGSVYGPLEIDYEINTNQEM